MRQLRTGSRVIALMALLGTAIACGSVPASTAGTGAKGVTVARGAAAHGSSRPTAASPAGLSASQVIWDKEHGIAVHGKPTGVKHADLLNGVSCAGGQCVAVGAWYYGVKSEHTLVELWTGKAWRLEPSGDGPKYSALDAVSCAAAPAAASGTSGTSGGSPGCLALGTPTLAGFGSHWRPVVAPANLTAVSCTSADACVAVGTRPPAPGTPVFAIWNGRTWHAGRMHAAPPQAEQAAIASVSCAAADNCVAVGDYSYGITAQPGTGARDRTLAEQWNGRTWRLLPAADVSHLDRFTAVSCAARDECTVVGVSQEQFPLAEHWNGKTWRVEPVPTVNSIGYVQLTGVSCVSTGFCVASGTYQGEPIAETWNGAKWRITRLPQPPIDNFSAQLNGVSCASAQDCVAIGTDGGAASYAERYAAGKWELSVTQNPQ